MKYLGLIVGVLGILLTIKPFFRNTSWLVRMGDFPRLQILILLVFALLVWLFTLDVFNPFYYIFAAALIAAAVYQIFSILPFTALYPKEVQWAREKTLSETNLSLLIFNILMDNNEFGRVLRLIEKYDSDLVLLAEPNQEWMDNLKDLEKKYQHIVACPLENRYGLILYSRLELHDTELQFLIQDDIPSIHTQVTLRSGDSIALHGIHPRPPAPGEGGRSTERDGELLLVAKALRESNLPCIVCGDMNDAAWSYTTKLFKRISGLLDPRVGRGFYNTFHAHHRFLRMPLDHIFHSNHFRLIHIERVNDSCGSDHFPVFVKLSYEKSATAEQSIPVAHLAESEEARERIGEALEENRYGRMSVRKLKEKINKLKEKILRKK